MNWRFDNLGDEVWQMSRTYLGFLFVAVMLLLSVCGENQGSAQSPGDAIVEQFMTTPIPGSRPFSDLSTYLQWLAGRPGNDSFTTQAQPLGGDRWLIQISLVSDDGRVVTAECSFDAQSGALGADMSTGPVWFACPQLATLWASHAPTAFNSLEAARPFLPPEPYFFLPEPPPGSYRLVRIELPASADLAAADPFLTTAIFVDEADVEVRLLEQPAGLNGPVFRAFNQCRNGTLPNGDRCRAFAGMGTYFLLTTDNATDAVLAEFEQRIRR